MLIKGRILKSSVMLLMVVCLATCGVDIPKEKQSSYETMTVNMYNGAQGIIALYIALGGATR